MSLLLSPQPLLRQPKILLGDEKSDLGVLRLDVVTGQSLMLRRLGDDVSTAKFHQSREPLDDEILEGSKCAFGVVHHPSSSHLKSSLARIR